MLTMTDEQRPKAKKSASTAFYLGPPDETKRRLAALDEMAGRLGINRSKLIAAIADGKYLLTVAPPGWPDEWVIALKQ